MVAPEALQERDDLGLDRDVERRGRLIGDDQLRLGGEREREDGEPGEADRRPMGQEAGREDEAPDDRPEDGQPDRRLPPEVGDLAVELAQLGAAISRPLAREPGTFWNYSSADSMLMSGVIQTPPSPCQTTYEPSATRSPSVAMYGNRKAYLLSPPQITRVSFSMSRCFKSASSAATVWWVRGDPTTQPPPWK